MRVIRIYKFVINICVGESGDCFMKVVKVLELIIF